MLNVPPCTPTEPELSPAQARRLAALRCAWPELALSVHSTARGWVVELGRRRPDGALRTLALGRLEPDGRVTADTPLTLRPV